MKGILLAAGLGSRLYPITKGTSKHLMAVYDKPMIYYPLSTLMLAGIRDILIITKKQDYPYFHSLLEDGSQWGIQLSYAFQDTASGLAEAFMIGEAFLAGQPCCLVLGDNIFYGNQFISLIQQAKNDVLLHQGANILCYRVVDPTQYGVLELDANQRPKSIEEKPSHPKSNLAIVGLYFFDSQVCSLAQTILPSSRGELEITDILLQYLQLNQLSYHRMGRGFAWMDAGSPENLLEASNFVYSIEQRQGLKIACLEEIAYRLGWINQKQLHEVIRQCPKGSYRNYLTELSSQNLLND